TRTSKSAGTSPKTGRFLPSTAITSSVSTATSSVAITPARGVGAGETVGAGACDCARSGAERRRAAPARTLLRTRRFIAAGGAGFVPPVRQPLVFVLRVFGARTSLGI